MAECRLSALDEIGGGSFLTEAVIRKGAAPGRFELQPGVRPGWTVRIWNLLKPALGLRLRLQKKRELDGTYPQHLCAELVAPDGRKRYSLGFVYQDGDLTKNPPESRAPRGH